MITDVYDVLPLISNYKCLNHLSVETKESLAVSILTTIEVAEAIAIYHSSVREYALITEELDNDDYFAVISIILNILNTKSECKYLSKMTFKTNLQDFKGNIYIEGPKICGHFAFSVGKNKWIYCPDYSLLIHEFKNLDYDSILKGFTFDVYKLQLNYKFRRMTAREADILNIISDLLSCQYSIYEIKEKYDNTKIIDIIKKERNLQFLVN